MSDQDIGGKALNVAQSLFKRGADVARQQTRLVMLQNKIGRLRDKKEKAFLKMGQKVFALFQKELVKNADLRLMCQEVRGLDAEIASLEEQMEQLRRGDSVVGREEGVDAEAADVEAADTAAPAAAPPPPPAEPPRPLDPYPQSPPPPPAPPAPERPIEPYPQSPPRPEDEEPR